MGAAGCLRAEVSEAFRRRWWAQLQREEPQVAVRLARRHPEAYTLDSPIPLIRRVTATLGYPKGLPRKDWDAEIIRVNALDAIRRSS